MLLSLYLFLSVTDQASFFMQIQSQLQRTGGPAGLTAFKFHPLPIQLKLLEFRPRFVILYRSSSLVSSTLRAAWYLLNKLTV